MRKILIVQRQIDLKVSVPLLATKEGIKRQLNAMHTVSMVLVYLMTL